MQFSNIPGHSALKQALITSFKNNHLAHAQLFSGREGGAAFPLVISYATYLLCENKSEFDSCGSCSACQKMMKIIHPDVHYFYPSPKVEKESLQSKQAELWREFITNSPFGNLDDLMMVMETENKVNQISKDDARRIIKTVSMKSFEGGLKILVIWYPEHMHPNAANAILKSLEEPPENTIYFLVTHNYENLLTTIVSRTQLITVPAFSEEDIFSYLKNEKKVPDEKAHFASKLAEGSLRVALSELTSKEDINFEEFQDWMRACFAANFQTLLFLSEKFGQESKSKQNNFLLMSISLVRNALLINRNHSLMNIDNREEKFLRNFSSTVSFNALEDIYRELNETLHQLNRNANPKITHLALSIRLSEKFNQKQ